MFKNQDVAKRDSINIEELTPNTPQWGLGDIKDLEVLEVSS